MGTDVGEGVIVDRRFAGVEYDPERWEDQESHRELNSRRTIQVKMQGVRIKNRQNTCTPQEKNSADAGAECG